MNQNLLLSYFNKQAYNNRIPTTAVIELLTACNLKCEHCYLPSHNDFGYSLKEIKKLIVELRELGVIHLLLTGGEIFLRKDIIEIIKFARDLHLRVTLLSNATLLTNELVNSIGNLYITEFSTTIFSLTPQINDSITKVPGSLEKIKKNILLLKSAGVRVKIKMPVMQKNVDSFSQLKDYCNENDMEFMPTFCISSKINGEKSPCKLRVDKQKLRDVLARLDDSDPLFQKHTYVPDDPPCQAIFCSFSIDCKGDVFPCNSIPFKIGNIYECSIKDIWYNSPQLKYIQNIKKSEINDCVTCQHRDYCHRCPGLAMLEGEGLYACDPLAKCVAEAQASLLR